MRHYLSLASVFILVGSVSSFAQTAPQVIAPQEIAPVIANSVDTVTPNAVTPNAVAIVPTISIDEFLEKMDGKFSGKGIAEIIGKKRDNILCKVENVYDGSKDGLLLSGNCASVKGKKAVSGKITYIDGKLSGALISGANVEITKSYGSIVKDTMVLTTYAMHNKTGKLTRVRQEISHTDSGITTIFYRYNNKKREYLKVGSLDLERLL